MVRRRDAVGGAAKRRPTGADFDSSSGRSPGVTLKEVERMNRNPVLVVSFSVVTILFVMAGVVSADDRWVEVAPSAAGTPPTVNLESNASGAVLEVDLAGFFIEERLVNGTDYSLLKVPGCGAKGALGEPHMPFRTVLVPIPNGPSVDMRVETTSSRTALMGVTVLPEQAPVPECGASAPDFVIDDKAYATDAWFPSQPAHIAQDVVVRG
jgi:hypothetical protein